MGFNADAPRFARRNRAGAWMRGKFRARDCHRCRRRFRPQVARFPEELLAAALARELGRPVEWIEDRREHLIASQHAKDQIVRGELAVARDGTILGLRAHITCDIGASTEYPWRTFEANVTAMAMPGPYRIPAYQYTTVSVAPNKYSIGASRGVGQPIGVFAMERLVDI